MCKPGKKLKLCTCSNEPNFDKLKVKMMETWALESADTNVTVIGEMVTEYNEFDSQEKYLLDQLNDFDPFDFNYIPKEGDKLTIIWYKRVFKFVMKDLKWIIKEREV